MLSVAWVLVGLLLPAAAPAATPVRTRVGAPVRPATPTPRRIHDMPTSAPAATRPMPDAEEAQDANDPNSDDDKDDADDAEDEGEGEAGMGHLGRTTGVLSLALLLLTVCLSGFQRLRPGTMRDWHKITGCLALLAGIMHALIMLLG
jgi:hypothetical protein